MEIKKLEDYYENVYKQFPDVNKKDIETILKFGWRALPFHIDSGADIIIRDNEFLCYLGKLWIDSLTHFKYYIKKQIIKIRLLNKKLKILWEGYYYFALTDKEYQNLQEQNKSKGRPRKKFYYGNQMLYRLLDECRVAKFNRKYIFRVPVPINLGIKFYKPNFESKEAELIEVRKDLKFKNLLNTNFNYTYK